MSQVLFITGTDTGVGKTLLTALLVTHLRNRGLHALAMKPFSSGSWQDARILSRAQDQDIPLRTISPFHFDHPVAPLVAARRVGRTVPLAAVVDTVKSLAASCQLLLVEGVGGLLVPLGRGYTVADLIAELRASTILVARNKLGTVNHTLLTLAALRSIRASVLHVALMGSERRDLATRTNHRLLAELCAPVEVSSVPWLGRNPAQLQALRANEKKMKKTLARILEADTVSSASAG